MFRGRLRTIAAKLRLSCGAPPTGPRGGAPRRCYACRAASVPAGERQDSGGRLSREGLRFASPVEGPTRDDGRLFAALDSRGVSVYDIPVRTSPRQTTTLTATEAAVLGLLATGESSGYDLLKFAKDSVAYFWSPARSQLYSILPGLVTSGLATRRTVKQKNRPDKQLYKITRAGKAALRDWINSEQPPEPDRNPLLLQLFFGEQGDAAALLERVRERRQQLEQLEAAVEEFERLAPDNKTETYRRMTRRYGLAYARALTRWARETEKALEELASP
jgi:PadR family transcriptional regulator AphA